MHQFPSLPVFQSYYSAVRHCCDTTLSIHYLHISKNRVDRGEAREAAAAGTVTQRDLFKLPHFSNSKTFIWVKYMFALSIVRRGLKKEQSIKLWRAELFAIVVLVLFSLISMYIFSLVKHVSKNGCLTRHVLKIEAVSTFLLCCDDLKTLHKSLLKCSRRITKLTEILSSEN